jgi:hypothetical protein
MAREWSKQEVKERLAEAVGEARQCREEGDERNVEVIHGSIDWMLDKLHGTGMYANRGKR